MFENREKRDFRRVIERIVTPFSTGHTCAIGSNDLGEFRFGKIKRTIAAF